VANAAEDVEAIATELGLGEFSVVGRSGGGPHALACAALLPHRVAKVAVLVTLAPSDAEGLDWYDGMGEWNVREYRHLEEDDSGSLNAIVKSVHSIQGDPGGLLDGLGSDLSDSDRRIVGDLGIREQLTDTYRESVLQGSAGWLDDVLAFRRPWGFDAQEIKNSVPVLFWHGSEDRFSPVHHTRWLADRVEHAEVWLEKDASHFDAVEVLPTILAWTTARDPLHRFADQRILGGI
jgi:pimeloyl-ACP methyl ester carboxylesterase